MENTEPNKTRTERGNNMDKSTGGEHDSKTPKETGAKHNTASGRTHEETKTEAQPMDGEGTRGPRQQRTRRTREARGNQTVGQVQYFHNTTNGTNDPQKHIQEHDTKHTDETPTKNLEDTQSNTAKPTARNRPRREDQAPTKSFPHPP